MNEQEKTLGTPPASPQPKKEDKTKKGVKSPRRRRRRGIVNFLLFVGIIAAIALFAWAEMQRRDAISQLKETEQELEKIKEFTERGGSQVAQEVLEAVGKVMDIPTDPQPTVATIVDVESLREASPFYDKAENGDHLVITETRAILYDSDRGIILDVVPVSINQEQQQQIPEGEEGQQPQEQEAGPTPAGEQQQQQEEQPAEPAEQPQETP